MRTCVVDIETDGLDAPSTIWCIGVVDVNTREQFLFVGPEGLKEFVVFASEIGTWIGHNFIDFDHRHLTKLLGLTIPRENVVDTLVVSQLIDAKRGGAGHSLESWGLSLGHRKGDHSDWSKYTDEMGAYCLNDCELNRLVYEALVRVMERNPNVFDAPLVLELKTRWIARDLHDNGFGFNKPDALTMRTQLEAKCSDLLTVLSNVFPPKSKLIREVTPKETKHGTVSQVGIKNWYKGTDYRCFTPGCSFSLIEWIPFNPLSSRQVVPLMNSLGWKPTDRTKTYLDYKKERNFDKMRELHSVAWKVNEQNLSTLPSTAPKEAQLLIDYIITAARIRTLNEWLENYKDDTKSIHGYFNPLGTVTHRYVHSKPNMGNIATAKTIKYNSPALRKIAIDYGGRMRSMWVARPGRLLVGCDQEGAHLRIFAHLIDDKEFTKSLISGSKDNGTDAHSLNKQKLGSVCVDRDRSKTFIFSYLNGARAPKVSEIFACSRSSAEEALHTFTRAYPGLEFLKREVIPADAARGYFIGIDGRYVKWAHEHGMMGMYLQNAEAIIQKHANVLWQEQLRSEHVPFWQVNIVHDEFVTEVPDDPALAQYVGAVQAKAIRTAGEHFKLRCPTNGEVKIGKNWLEVH